MAVMNADWLQPCRCRSCRRSRILMSLRAFFDIRGKEWAIVAGFLHEGRGSVSVVVSHRIVNGGGS